MNQRCCCCCSLIIVLKFLTHSRRSLSVLWLYIRAEVTLLVVCALYVVAAAAIGQCLVYFVCVCVFSKYFELVPRLRWLSTLKVAHQAPLKMSPLSCQQSFQLYVPVITVTCWFGGLAAELCAVTVSASMLMCFIDCVCFLVHITNVQAYKLVLSLPSYPV